MPARARLQDQWTAAMIAAQNGHKEALEVLIGAGGDVNAANKVRRDGRVWWSVGGEEEGRG